jgi:hypothetical protein
MGIYWVGSPQAVSPQPGHGLRLDRRRLVQGAVAASLAGVAGRVSSLKMVRAAGAPGYPDALSRTAASRVSTDSVTAVACLEASLHVMLR